jgi:hypothetical protein
MPQPWSLVHVASILFCVNHSLLSFLFCSYESRGEIPVKGGSLVTTQNFKFWNVTKIHKMLKLFLNRIKLI